MLKDFEDLKIIVHIFFEVNIKITITYIIILFFLKKVEIYEIRALYKITNVLAFFYCD